MQNPDPKRKAASSRDQLPRHSTGAAPSQSTPSFGQVTTSGRKGRKVLDHDAMNRHERFAPLNADANAEVADGRGSKELFSQLQRLQALQQEAQSLLT